ncbi:MULTISPECIES: hypothetical protein [Psychrobacter]|uniref:hypothetical protein n=1 Tax=Psychrobacter TaxID=497 RepID=UPI0015C92800|nr:MULTISPECIES: hypothetical protein [Psychrobacter]NYR10842.1 hypothetical protein [Psychrobacter sp. BI730]
MKENTSLTAYELGLIKNSLRERLISLEDYGTEYLNTDSDDANEKAEMSINIDSFKMELNELKDKIDVLTETQITKANPQ